MSGYRSTGRRLAAALAGMVAGAIAGLPVAWVGLFLFVFVTSGDSHCYDCSFALIFLAPVSMVICAAIGAVVAAKSAPALGAVLGMAVGSAVPLYAMVQGWVRSNPNTLVNALAILGCGVAGALIGWWLVARIGARSRDQDASGADGPE